MTRLECRFVGVSQQLKFVQTEKYLLAIESAALTLGMCYR